MYRTDLFTQKKAPLKYTMPFARLIPYTTPAGDTVPVVLNKDGGIQTTWSYCGPDLESSVSEDLALLTMHLNNILKEIDSGFVLYFEAQRHESSTYRTDVHFPDPLTELIDEERKRFFSNGHHYESNYFCTLYQFPRSDMEDKMQEMMIEGRKKKEFVIDEALEPFLDMVEKLIVLFRQFHVPSEILDMDEMLTYLHSTVSDNSRELKFPEKPALLDQLLYDVPLYGGLAPRLGSKHMRVVTPVKYARGTCFGFFDALNQLDFEYRWVSRYYCLSKIDSIDEVGKLRKEWYGKIKGIGAMIKENIKGYEDDRNNNVAAQMNYDEAGDAVTEIENDIKSYGFYSTSIIILDDDPMGADDKAKLVINTLMKMGLTAKSEGMNAVDAWMGSIPGNVGHMKRRPMISTGNLVHMIPLSNIWPGDTYCKQLEGPSLIYTQTTGNTPFRFNIHVGNVGHSMVVGKTGGGKSVFLNTMEAQFRKYENARVFVFDKGSSSIALTLGVGGQFYDLGSEEGAALSFQPLLHADEHHEQEWLLGWLTDFLISENVKVTPLMSKKILAGIQTVAAYPDVKLRRMTNLVNAINDKELKIALAPLTVDGAYGRTFDADHESLSFSSWQTFEMEKMMQNKLIIGTVLMYIFHRIEQELDGRPTLIVLDECWAFFQNEQFAKKIMEWLRVLRKYNTSVVFATQEMETIVNSAIFDTVNTNCNVKIFLPDPRNITDEVAKTYRTLGINAQQMKIIHEARLHHDYYYSSSKGARLFDLALEYCPLTLAYVGVGTKDVRKAKEINKLYPQREFNRRWLEYKNIELV